MFCQACELGRPAREVMGTRPGWEELRRTLILTSKSSWLAVGEVAEKLLARQRDRGSLRVAALLMKEKGRDEWKGELYRS